MWNKSKDKNSETVPDLLEQLATMRSCMLITPTAGVNISISI